ncbi:MAG: THUMP domain-containing protein [Candidatus Thorarchaeota archaeon]
MNRYNLLVGCPRERERAARSEVRYFIGDLLDDSGLKIHQTHISGLLACRTSQDPFEVVHRLREFATENPFQFRFAIKFIPLELSVPTDIEQIKGAVEKVRDKIREEDTFRVTVRHRHSDLKSMDVITEVARLIDRRVDLDNPDKTLWIEIVGEWTGVSVLVPEEDILSIMTMRDDMY